MQKIGFFGGCFNPPTIAHLNLAKNAIENFQLDKVIFVPMNDFYEKKGLISQKHRYNMLKIMLENEPKLEVSNFELNKKEKMYAIDAFNYINEKYNCEKYFIMGSDNFSKIDNWKNSNELKKFKFIVQERKNKIEQSENVYKINSNNFSYISSSEVRTRILTGIKINEYITEDVYRYIKFNNLYFEKED